MKIDFLTLFPDMIEKVIGDSITGRGIKAGYLDVRYIQIRDYTENKQKKVDDYPYGGGPGLIMQYQPIKSAYDAIVSENKQNKEEKPYCIYMSPQGKTLVQAKALELSKKSHIVILCGHYEGIDERIIEDIVDEEISIGDYVLTGGEIPGMVLADCVSRLIPGVLASEDATVSESHSEGLLEYPQYSRPEIINGKAVPAVLLCGNHAQIVKWRYEQSVLRTEKKRPDLIKSGNMHKEIYLDNSATTAMSENALNEYSRVSINLYGNPSSLHHLGFIAEKELKKCRKDLAEIVGCNENEIHFTSGGTESNNWAIRGFTLANPRAGKHIILSSIEHPSVLLCAQNLQKEGYSVDTIPVKKNGVIDLKALEKMITPETSFISVMHVNNEIGAIQPIAKIAEIKNRINKKIILHVDGVQSFAKLDVREIINYVDLFSVSGHKIHGPRGVGFLYIRKGVRLEPLMYGGGQDNGLRSGTENLPAIVAMTCAAKESFSLIKENYDIVESFRNKMVKNIKRKIRDCRIITDPNFSSPYILNVAFPNMRAEVILHKLEAENVYVSVGSACSSHKKNRSHVLLAMGLDNEVIDGSIRISFSKYNTETDIENALNALYKATAE